MHLCMKIGEDIWKRSWITRENVLISFKHDYRTFTLSSRFDVITDVINMMKNFHEWIAYGLSIADVKLELYGILKNVEK